MKRTIVLIVLIVVALTFSPAVVSAQQGKALGVGVGSQVKVGTGANAGANAGGVKAGVGAKSSTEVKTEGKGEARRAEGKGEARSSVLTHIEANPRLESRLKTMLPSGTTMAQASSGFKNQGQFIACLHVSKNLGIPFDELKANMTGKSSMSLGAAIHKSRPGMDEKKAGEEAKRAEKEAKDDEDQAKKDQKRDQ